MTNKMTKRRTSRELKTKFEESDQHATTPPLKTFARSSRASSKTATISRTKTDTVKSPVKRRLTRGPQATLSTADAVSPTRSMTPAQTATSPTEASSSTVNSKTRTSKVKKQNSSLPTQVSETIHGVAGQTRSESQAQTTTATTEDDERFKIPLIVTIRELWRRRQAWHRAEKSLTLLASSICRRHCGVQGKGDKVNLARASALLKAVEDGNTDSNAATDLIPIFMGRGQIEPQRLAVEKVLEQLAAQTPVAFVVEETKGLGYLSLASIVGEAGRLSAYRSHQSLWKRMGLAVINGERQRCKTDAVEAAAHAYSPPRRSVMWNVGNSLIGGMGRGPRPMVGEDVSKRSDLTHWQKLFIARLRYEVARDESHRRPNVERDGFMYESFSKHAANRAKRKVEKMFLKYLYQNWKKSEGMPVPSTEPLAPISLAA